MVRKTIKSPSLVIYGLDEKSSRKSQMMWFVKGDMVRRMCSGILHVVRLLYQGVGALPTEPSKAHAI